MGRLLMVKERPIIFNTEMVKAILDGRKTQTRRILKVPKNGRIKPGTVVHSNGVISICFDQSGCAEWKMLKCPHGKIGEHLWVRETWATEKYCDNKKPSELHGIETIWFLSDGDYNGIGTHTQGKTRPSIFMPRWASRINLEITDIRVERVQDISRDDCIEEGVPQTYGGFKGLAPEWASKDKNDASYFYDNRTSRENFYLLWNSINAKGGYSWESNPHVWVIKFKKAA